ncbi:MAG: winged helix-turn-helix domain-containing protein [Candidatus Heimdallarchaeota archaeon]
MRRSKLEMQVDILKALAFHGRLKLTHIMYKANVNCGALKQYLDLLIQYNLVKEHTLHKKRAVYAITERGLTALKNVREIYNALPIIEEAEIPSITILSKSQQHL